MADLAPGDQVLTSNGYQMLYAQVHQSDTQSTEFLQIYTDQNPDHPLEITGAHMVVVANRSNPIPAFAVRPGDVLQAS